MSREPAFVYGGSQLWFLNGAGGCVAFFDPPPPNADADAIVPLMPLTRTWAAATGSYVFLPMPAPFGFGEALAAFLADFAPGPPPRFLWIENPDQSIATWRTSRIDLRQQSGGWIVAQRVNFDLDGYVVTIRGGGTVAVADGGAAGWGFAFADGGAPAAALLTPNASLDARAASTSLAMAGGAAGCWRFALDMPAGGQAFEQLDAGIRYFMPGGATGTVQTIPFVTLTQPNGTALAFFATIDPLRPDDAGRSHLGLFAWDGSGTATPLGSGFATARGYGVGLTPLAAPTPARLAFHTAPSDQGDGRDGRYLAPDGPFSIQVNEPGAGAANGGLSRLICGVSGLEYFGLATPAGATINFVAGRAAYAPGPEVATLDGFPLTTRGTTAWAYLAETYYSQPEDAPLFSASDPVSAAAGYLDFLEVPCATLPAADGVRAFPMAPFRAIDPNLADAALRLEQTALAPMRRALIDRITTASISPADHAAHWRASLAAADGAAETVGVTPQGMAVGVAGAQWTWVGLAHGDEAPADRPSLRFTQAAGAFRQGLQTNALFMVLGDAATFATAGSVAYQLTAHDIAILRASPAVAAWPPGDFDAVAAAIAAAGYPLYKTRTAFAAAMTAARASLTAAQIRMLGRQAGQLTPIVADWRFLLSPDAWRHGRPRGENSYLIFKFSLGRSLVDLVRDRGAWTWPEAAAASGTAHAKDDILASIAKAAAQGPGSVYADFIALVNDPDWTGVLALAIDVPLDALPDQLQALAAGIDPAAFFAHHIGFAMTPFAIAATSPPQISFQRTATFGLIDYENPEDQYFASDIAYAFRVLQLTVAFRNSAVSSFASRVELMVNRLFGADARLLPADHGNNMILAGGYQRQVMPGGATHDSYVFASTDDYLYLLPGGGALQSVEILSIQLLTSKAAAPGTIDVTVDATFQMTGALRLVELDGFDPFCWGAHADPANPANVTDGALRFGNMAVGMRFSLADPAASTVFTLRDGDLSFDIANSAPRADALVSRFPARLKRLIVTPDPALASEVATLSAADPSDIGYVTIGAPVDQGKLTAPWYALNYAIDLGSLGALANSAALSLELLAAWSPTAAGTPPLVYLGIKLPGADARFGTSLPLQGVLKLGFKSIEFLVDQPVGGDRRYALRLRDFALQLLSISFPPGRNEIYLFGNPDQSADTAVGWYAAYTSGKDRKKLSAPPGRPAIRAARAALRVAGSTAAAPAGECADG